MTSARGTGPDTGIKSTDTLISILEVLQSRDGAGVTEIAEELDRSKSTVHSHLQSLRAHRCVRKDGTTYRLGLRFLSFGGHACNRTGLLEIVRPEVDGLVEETGETAQMVVEEHGRGIYVCQSRGAEAVRTDSHVGTEVGLHCTAVGKAILAHLPEDRVREIADRHGLPPRTDETVTDLDELFAALERVRERGYAIDDGERIPGIRCVAAPVRTDDSVIGALSVNGPTKRLEGEYFREELPSLVGRAARVVEINATYA
ncbi:IclR family transcriptional regulator [Saliphagus sp. LR7]|uniref:IclR family transcriptional regulator n=1 Tax=Saliphagus sp. LR7 TaxID=2282654 RepID=UPI000DF7422D|nr:IclR family transcriptional regulator [Saliphagus sp. LR7]